MTFSQAKNNTIVLGGKFNTNYIIFRNVEISKIFFLKENEESDRIFKETIICHNGILKIN